MATVLAFGALLGTMKNFGALVQGASSVCFGVDGALIALYGCFLGAGRGAQRVNRGLGSRSLGAL